jgi:hypothetical protein
MERGEQAERRLPYIGPCPTFKLFPQASMAIVVICHSVMEVHHGQAVGARAWPVDLA